MLVRVFYENGEDVRKFEYYSKYERINAKGIEEEIKSRMARVFGKKASYYVIKSYERVDE